MAHIVACLGRPAVLLAHSAWFVLPIYALVQPIGSLNPEAVLKRAKKLEAAGHVQPASLQRLSAAPSLQRFTAAPSLQRYSAAPSVQEPDDPAEFRQDADASGKGARRRVTWDVGAFGHIAMKAFVRLNPLRQFQSKAAAATYPDLARNISMCDAWLQPTELPAAAEAASGRTTVDVEMGSQHAPSGGGGGEWLPVDRSAGASGHGSQRATAENEAGLHHERSASAGGSTRPEAERETEM